MIEPEEHCSFITKWTVPHLWAKFTNDHPMAVQQPWQPDTTSKDQAPAYMPGRRKQLEATSTLTARGPCVKNGQASSKTLNLDSCFGLNSSMVAKKTTHER